jgi:sigma-B regulation protein RsbU (phosphoserine phosphatase)
MSLNNHTNRYTIYGTLFGALFPLMASIIDSLVVFGSLSFDYIIILQKQSHLHWIIDSAPFWLGLFARFIGMKQDKVDRQINDLHEINNKINAEIEKRNKIEEKLVEKSWLIEEQLEAAKTIQESFLPELPENNLVDLGYRYLPMDAVGGDFISLLNLREGAVSIFIGDVTGHGVSAALIFSLVNVLANKTGRVHGNSPKNYLKALNNELIEYMPDCSYLTAIYGLLSRDPENSEQLKFVFSRGAQPYPVLLHAETKEAEVIESAGFPLGFLEDTEYDELTISMKKGDRLYLFTDGIIEAKNKDKEIVDFANFIKYVEEADQNNYSIEDTLDFVINKVKEFSGEVPIHDDQLLLCVEAK